MRHKTRVRPSDIIPHLYEGELVKYYDSSRCNDYYITSYGRFIAVWYKDWKFLTRTPTSHQVIRYHHQVRMPQGAVSVHREVGKHFLPDYKEELFVCHTDEDADDKFIQSVYNLWMGTHSDNMRDAYSKGRKVPSNQFM